MISAILGEEGLDDSGLVSDLRDFATSAENLVGLPSLEESGVKPIFLSKDVIGVIIIPCVTPRLYNL
jgi:hypothetical protein